MSDLEKILYAMLDDFKSHTRSRAQITEDTINARLNCSLINYYKSLSESLTFLQKQDTMRMCKTVDREE